MSITTWTLSRAATNHRCEPLAASTKPTKGESTQIAKSTSSMRDGLWRPM